MNVLLLWSEGMARGYSSPMWMTFKQALELVLHSTEHLPPQFRDRFGAWIDWSWAFVLSDLGDGRTRFHFRTRARLGPPWLAAAYWLVLVPADHVMARQMLAGVRRRAEGRLG